jgi:type II secretion system protein J
MKTARFESKTGRAFTLIEILVAIAILGMIMSSLYSVWSAMLRATKTGNDSADRVQRQRIARSAVQTALESVQLYQANMPFYAFEADTENEDFAFLSFVSHLPRDFPGTGMFPNFPVRRVTFEVVEDGSNGLPQLNMSQRLLLSDTNEIDESYTMALVTNIGLFNLEFWDTNEGEWVVEWMETNYLPPMARLVIGYDGDTDADKLHTSVIGLGSQPVPLELQIQRQSAPRRR